MGVKDTYHGPTPPLETDVNVDGDDMTLSEAIGRIPEGGWWKDACREGYNQLALDLIGQGSTAQQAFDVLSDAYSMAAGCFGS